LSAENGARLRCARLARGAARWAARFRLGAVLGCCIALRVRDRPSAAGIRGPSRGRAGRPSSCGMEIARARIAVLSSPGHAVPGPLEGPGCTGAASRVRPRAPPAFSQARVRGGGRCFGATAQEGRVRGGWRAPPPRVTIPQRHTKRGDAWWASRALAEADSSRQPRSRPAWRVLALLGGGATQGARGGRPARPFWPDPFGFKGRLGPFAPPRRRPSRQGLVSFWFLSSCMGCIHRRLAQQKYLKLTPRALRSTLLAQGGSGKTRLAGRGPREAAETEALGRPIGQDGQIGPGTRVGARTFPALLARTGSGPAFPAVEGWAPFTGYSGECVGAGRLPERRPDCLLLGEDQRGTGGDGHRDEQNKHSRRAAGLSTQEGWRSRLAAAAIDTIAVAGHRRIRRWGLPSVRTRTRPGFTTATDRGRL